MIDRPDREWLEADGLGGFAMGTASGRRTRRYHAALLSATTPPTGRMVLVNGYDAWVTIDGEQSAISTQRYAPGVDAPDGVRHLTGFTTDPWPRWTYGRVCETAAVEHELFAVHGASMTALSWKLSGAARATLTVRLYLSGRDYHGMHHENPAFRFTPASSEPGRTVWRPYDGVPAIGVVASGAYEHDPHWYRSFTYEADRERGLDHVEDLASPGIFRFELAAGEEAIMILTSDEDALTGAAAADAIGILRSRERARRAAQKSSVERAADAYLVRRGDGMSIVAGYPWFCDWGRDTFISLRGLCLATGRFDEARAILREWAAVVSEGMLPNRFSDVGDAGEQAEYNSVDASLWYIVAAHAFFGASSRARYDVPPADRAAIEAAIIAIVDGYARGTRMNIRADYDGLLAAGAPGWQLTWMDARVDGQVVTPRIGKPVEIQALWINALRIAADLRLPSSDRWETLHARASKSFGARFWYEAGGYLYDVVDDNFVPGSCDSRLRPNQIYAIGGLPYAILDGDRAARVVAVVESALLTPIGLRSLAPSEPGYAAHYTGDARASDRAYHNGTVWPFLLGAFVEAFVRVRGSTAEARQIAKKRFYEPILGHLGEAGINHLPEIADGDAPHTPRGCPFQAWSVGELARIAELLQVLGG